MTVDAQLNTSETFTVLAKVSAAKKNGLIEQLAHVSNLADISIFHETKMESFFRLTFFNGLKKEIDEAFQKFEVKITDLASEFSENYPGMLPREIQKQLDKKHTEIKEQVKEKEARLQQLGKTWDDLRIAHDFYSWKKEKNEAQDNVLQTSYIFAFEEKKIF